MAERVNKVSAIFEDDNVRISLYRTNIKLVETTSYSLGVPPFSECGMPSKTLYINYCKDLIINLLENGGIDGYYYEPKQISDTQKYDKSGFTHGAIKSLSEILDSLQIKYEMRGEPDVEIIEKYKDNYVKDAKTDIRVKIGNNIVTIPVEIKSGQMCKPKIFKTEENEFSLNITNLNKL